jgi:hypothetical protein
MYKSQDVHLNSFWVCPCIYESHDAHLNCINQFFVLILLRWQVISGGKFGETAGRKRFMIKY